MVQTQKLRFIVLLIFIAAWVTSSCSGSGSETHPFSMAPLDSMPEEIRQAPVTVQQAYQFAVANPDIVTKIPCYCGCGDMGHTSNYACYVSGSAEGGSVQFDSHALGCSICVDITQDAMRLTEQGKTAAEIRAFIDQTYAKYGPSNMP